MPAIFQTFARIDLRAGAASIGWQPHPSIPGLHAHEVHVYVFDLDSTRWDRAEAKRVLSAEEMTRAGAFRVPHAGRRFMAGRATLREILGRYDRCSPREIRLGSSELGKPFLQAGREPGRIRFNVSHSDDRGMVVVRLDEDVGVDIERIRHLPKGLAIAERLFAPEEYRALESLPEEERHHRFFEHWTRKEAVVKALGSGLTRSLTFPVSCQPFQTLTVPGDPAPYAVYGLDPADRFVAAIATRAWETDAET